MNLPRFYPILDTAALSRCGISPQAAAAAILSAGARILQFRHKQHFDRVMFSEAEVIAQLCRQHGAVFVVNDRADIAALLDAALHLGQDDLQPAGARKLLPQRVIGFSTHNEFQLRAAADEPVDYLALGPVFATPSKLNPDPVVGLEDLRRLRPLSRLPLVAIGGITRANAQAALDAGADSVAVIGDLYSGGTSLSIGKCTEEWMRLIHG